jgi:hypothetical protein
VQDGGIPSDLGPPPLEKLAVGLQPALALSPLRAPAPTRSPPLHGLAVDAERAGDPLHPIIVQLVDHDSVVCLESVFAAYDLKTNTATKLKGKVAAP